MSSSNGNAQNPAKNGPEKYNVILENDIFSGYKASKLSRSVFLQGESGASILVLS